MQSTVAQVSSLSLTAGGVFVMSLSKTLYPLLSKTRKTCPDTTEKLILGRNVRNQTSKSLSVQSTRRAVVVILVFCIPVTLC